MLHFGELYPGGKSEPGTIIISHLSRCFKELLSFPFSYDRLT
jgi:hypothetical protein